MRETNKFIAIRPGEFLPAALMFGFFFSVITVFQTLKPLKRGLFLEYIGAQRELIAKNLNILVALLAMIAFTSLYNRLGGRRLIYALCAIFIAALLAFSSLMTETPSGPVNWVFYLFGDLWSTVWVASFWAFLNEISTSEQAKRLYGPIGAGGVIGGGLIGAFLVSRYVKDFGAQPLILLCAGLTLVIGLVVWQADRQARRPGVAVTYRRRPARVEPMETNAAVEGAKLVLSSKYLLAIVAIMGLYELCSQIMDFQYGTLAESGITGGRNTQAFLANVGLIVNALSVGVQLFLTSFIMRRFGVGIALMVLPFAMAFSSGAFLVVPTLFFASLLTIADNGFNYSINQTARETLYVPTSNDEQYKARAFTNMFVQRAGKGIATLIAAVFILIGVRWLSLVTIGIVLVWLVVVAFAGRRFRELSQATEEFEQRRIA